MKTKIEWAEKVWNPVTGCTPVSEGCRNCYAKRMATRLKGRCGYPADDPFRVTFHVNRLSEWERWKKPCRIFVCSMGDLFHEDVPFGYIDAVMCRIAWAKWHTFLVLTKRPERMREFFSRHIYENGGDPLPNLWLGVSVEDQATADERIPFLLRTPTAVRFVSYEPALGPVDFGNYMCKIWRKGLTLGSYIDWLIMGGESGPGARPMNPVWVRDTRDQCASAGVAYFFKQWGNGARPDGLMDRRRQYGYDPRAKKGGRIFDGRTWDEYPEVAE